MENINVIDNYIYLYHLDSFVVLPTMPERLSDQLNTSFSQTPIMMRTAPIFSYSYSGPRTINVSLNLRRDMFEALNINVSNLSVAVGDDYVDTIIKALQAAALPRYAVANKMVDPPMVAVRFGNDIFIKGVVMSGVQVEYGLPLLENRKYASVEIQFTVAEVDPYDAETVLTTGSLRGLSRTLERSLFKQN